MILSLTAEKLALSRSDRLLLDKQSFRVGAADNDPYDPADSKATSVFYALRKGLLVSGQIDHPTPVDGPFGSEKQGIGPFAVSLDNLQVAVVTRSELLVGPRQSAVMTELK